MTWTAPTYNEWVTTIRAIVKNTKSDIDTSYGSHWYILIHTLAHVAQGLSECSDNFRKDLHPSSTSSDWIDKWAILLGLKNNLDGIGRYVEAPSSGEAALEVTYTGSTSLAMGTDYVLYDPAGRYFRLDSTYTFTSAGSHRFDVISTGNGSAFNLAVGDTLTFESPPLNITETATLVVPLTGGMDSEDDPELLKRVLTRFSNKLLSGTFGQWAQEIEDYAPGSYKAFVWPRRPNYPYGAGCVDYAALKLNQTRSNRILTTAEENALEDHLYTVLPFYSMKNARQLSISEIQPVIEITFSLADSVDPSKPCDWDANSYQRYITTANSSTYTITVNNSYAASVIEVGDRVFIAGEEVVVSTAPSSSDSYTSFVVETWPWAGSIDLTDRGDGTGYYVMSGGGLIADLYEGVKDYLDSIGPAYGTYAAPIPDWDDTIRLSHLQSAFVIAGGGYVRDISSITIGGSTADYQPSYDNTSSVQLITYADIILWESSDDEYRWL